MPHQCTDCGRAFDDGSKEMLSGCPDCGGNKFQFKPEGYSGSEESGPPPEPPEPEMDSSVARTVGNAATAVRDLVGGRSRSSPADGASTQSSDPLHRESDTVESYHSDSNSSDPLPHESDPTRAGFSSGPESRVADTEGPPRPDTESPPRPDTEKLSRPDTESPSRPDTEKLSRTEREDSAQMSARSEIVSRDELPPAPDRFQSAPSIENSGGTGRSRPAGESSTRPQTTGSADRFGSSETGSKESKRTDRKRTGETERQAEHPSRSGGPDQPPASHSDCADQPSESSSDSAPDPSESRPDLSELRAELNDQFESIRVLEPGQYELNLMELFDREEYIVALQEDGKYTIQVPERWSE